MLCSCFVDNLSNYVDNLSNYVSQCYLPIIFFSFGGSHLVLVSALVGFGFWFSSGFGHIKQIWKCPLFFNFFGRVWGGLALFPLEMIDRLYQWSHLVLVWISNQKSPQRTTTFLVVGLFRLSVSSWFSLGKDVSSNLSISSRLSNLLVYNCFSSLS